MRRNDEAQLLHRGRRDRRCGSVCAGPFGAPDEVAG